MGGEVWYDLWVSDRPQPISMRSMPGIGGYSALLILSEIGDISRFPNEKHLVSYAGLAPGVRSAGVKTHYGHITK